MKRWLACLLVFMLALNCVLFSVYAEETVTIEEQPSAVETDLEVEAPAVEQDVPATPVVEEEIPAMPAVEEEISEAAPEAPAAEEGAFEAESEEAAVQETAPADPFVIEGDTLVRYDGDDMFVNVPDGIRCIGENSFYQNTNIVLVTMPVTVEVIKTSAFEGCENLQNVVALGLKTIEPKTFWGCEKLDRSFADEIEEVAADAFEAVETVEAAEAIEEFVIDAEDDGEEENSGEAEALLEAKVVEMFWLSEEGEEPDADGISVQALDNEPAPAGGITITKQPENCTKAVGETAEFTVEATGEGLKYQWQNSSDKETWNNSWLTGYNKATISVPVTEARYSLYWQCVVKDGSGNTETTDAVQILSPAAALKIVTQPTDVTKAVGETAEFTVEATGEGLKYQWQNSSDKETWNNSWLTGYNKATISVPVTEARYSLYWQCVVKDGSGNTATTDAVQIIKGQPVEITDVSFGPAMATIDTEITITTTKSVNNVYMYLGDEQIAAWNRNDQDITVEPGATTDTWKVAYVFDTTGEKALSFKASADGVQLSDAFTPQPLVVTVAVFGDYEYERFEDDQSVPGIRILNYIGQSATPVVPAQIQNLPILIIGESAFEGNTTITCVDLPDTVQIIGKRAFANCTNLSEMK